MLKLQEADAVLARHTQHLFFPRLEGSYPSKLTLCEWPGDGLLIAEWEKAGLGQERGGKLEREAQSFAARSGGGHTGTGASD